MYFKEEKEKNAIMNSRGILRHQLLQKSTHIKQYAIKKSFKNNNDSNLLYLEFGVWKGESMLKPTFQTY